MSLFGGPGPLASRYYARLYCVHPSSHSTTDLALDGVKFDISIVDVHSRVRMSQQFTNSFNVPVEATYSFAMLANSAVCAFEMVRGDGTKVFGKVMEKTEAKQVYDNAVRQGQTAALAEEQTKDVFSIKVGNILASETVTVNLTFLTPLVDDEKKDQVRFTLPRSYAMRYGTPPTIEASRAMGYAGTRQKVAINVTIQQARSIKSVSCPSAHPIQLSLGPSEGLKKDAGIPDSNFASVSMTSPTEFLAQDFILVVSAAGLDEPRCFVEPYPSPNESTTAFGITFVPRFKVPDFISGMEYIFVLDRSGSMGGPSIALLKEALVVLVRGLPSKNTSFNIVSFGSTADSLWPTSKEYAQASLDEATAYIDTIQANYGGTEIALALRTTFQTLSKQRNKPVSVFLLTDGGTWHIDSCENIIKTERSTPGEPIRVFSVGIGSGASTETTERIARAGEGMVIYIQQNEAMTGKLARLVRASRTPPVKDIKVSWPVKIATQVQAEAGESEDEFELVESPPASHVPAIKEKISLFNPEDDSEEHDVGAPPTKKFLPENITPPAIQLAPLSIPSLFPGTRTQIYAIVSNTILDLAKTGNPIKVTGTLSSTGQVLELEVPVAKVISSEERGISPIIHTLAAKSLITDREDGWYPTGGPIPKVTGPEYWQADIVRLGVKYGLSSRHTSFVAVDERKQGLGTGSAVVIVAPAQPVQPMGLFGAGPRTLAGGGLFVAQSYTPAPGPSPWSQDMALMSSSRPAPVLGAASGQPSPKSRRLMSMGSPQKQEKSGRYSPISSRVHPVVLGSSAPPSFKMQEAAIQPQMQQQQQMQQSSSQASFHSASRPSGFGSYSSIGSIPMTGATVFGQSASASLFGKSAGSNASPAFGSLPPVPPSVPMHSAAQSPPAGAGLFGFGGSSFAVPSGVAEKALTTVARMQRFDGSFALSGDLLKLLGIPQTPEQLTQSIQGVGGTENDAIATALAVLWMKKAAGDEAQDLIDKAEEWLSDNYNEEAVKSIMEQAKKYIS